MRLQNLEVDGFRCLSNFKVIFEEDLTLIVGENDCGKTSLIDCLKVVMHNKAVEIDDFTHGQNKIILKVKIEDFTFQKVYDKKDNQIAENPLTAFPSKKLVQSVLNRITDINFNLSTEENIAYIKTTAETFGISVRINSNSQNLLDKLRELLQNNIDNPDFEIVNAKFSDFNSIQLEGRQFENVSSFFKEVFLKEKQASIWKEKINGEQTIEEFIKIRIDNYSDEITEEINDSGIRDKIKLYLKDLTNICVEPVYTHRDLNIDAKVKFLVNGTEINVEKKGDGTKRRITLALLEYKKDKIIKGDSESTIYLLDEPDTHLHVKAQIELLDTLRSFAEKGDQIILTTHSPFIINAVNSNQIRLVEEKENCSQIKHLKQDSEVSNKILKALGIENTYLFFAKYIILAEGETEQEFIQSHYTKKYRKSISSDLIKIIPTKGINNIYGFARAILELHNRGNIFCIYDNDASEETKKLIDELQLHDTQRFILGDKEFEDCFDSTSLHGCWVSYLSECSKDTPENWTVKNIDEAKDKCTQDKSLKFSKQLVSLSAGSKKMTKPIFGRLLGEYVDEDNTPPRLKELFTLLK